MPTILQHAQHPQTKRFALTVMENLVRFRWNSLPADQQINIREYMIGYVMELSANPELLAESRLILDKANGVVVSVRNATRLSEPPTIADGTPKWRFFVTRSVSNFFSTFWLYYLALREKCFQLLTLSDFSCRSSRIHRLLAKTGLRNGPILSLTLSRHPSRTSPPAKTTSLSLPCSLKIFSTSVRPR